MDEHLTVEFMPFSFRRPDGTWFGEAVYESLVLKTSYVSSVWPAFVWLSTQ